MPILLIIITFLALPLHALVEMTYLERTQLLIPLYQDLHAHPELSFHEQNTSERFALELKTLGYEVTKNIGGYGVVGKLANGKGRTLLLRADLDALPLTEETGLKFASKQKQVLKDGREVGIMHACGHDIHMSSLLGVARKLSESKNLWKGTLLIIGQPAEEKGGGSKAMLETGLYRKFSKPDFALAFHVAPYLEAGKVGIKPGYLMANVDTLDITLKAKGGHGALPHLTIDPIVMASQLVLDLQTIISREKNPMDPGVITIGSIKAGSKHNIISDRAELQVTVRSLTSASRQLLLDGIERKAKAVAASFKAPAPEIRMTEEPVPSLYNDEKLTTRIRPVLEKTLGKENVVDAELQMIGEDFSRYREGEVPIVMLILGSIEKNRLENYRKKDAIPVLHSSTYYPDAEPTLLTGITAMSETALSLLTP